MDAFLNSRKTKNTSTVFASGTMTCVHGRPGIGKTYYVQSELPSAVIVDHEVLKSRQGTLDFMERLKLTSSAVVIDNWESVSDLVGVREISGPLSLGPTVIVSRDPVDIPGIVLYAMPPLTVDQLVALGGPSSRPLAEKCQGDVRSFLTRLKYGSDDQDVFETPREFVEKLLTCRHPTDYLQKTVHEHGYTWAMIQENYIDTKGITLEEAARLTESLSLADVYDTVIYRENAWDTLFPYFINEACVTPCSIIRTRLPTKKLRAGSIWTKFQNACMRAKKISSTGLGRESLFVVRVYVEHALFDILKEYRLDPSAIDVLNHIGLSKLRPKLVDQAKKFLRET